MRTKGIDPDYATASQPEPNDKETSVIESFGAIAQVLAGASAATPSCPSREPLGGIDEV